MNDAEYQRRYREEHLEERRAYFREYRRKKRAAMTTEERREENRKRDLRSIRTGRTARRYARNPEKFIAKTRAWQKANPERKKTHVQNYRARKKNAFIEEVDRERVHRRSNGLCFCGEPVELAEMHVDHVYPLSRGGKHCYNNVQAAHPVCNLKKHDSLAIADLGK